MMLFAILLCAVSVGTAYAASHHCGLGLVAALAALVVWARQLGIGTGVCVLLGCWALLATILPVLATVLPENPH